jgi:hypothetical protein
VQQQCRHCEIVTELFEAPGKLGQLVDTCRERKEAEQR